MNNPDITNPDLDFFFDPICPFAWQTSQWVRRLIELENITVEWRFISLLMLNEENPDSSDEMVAAHRRGLRYLRLLAAIRDREGSGRIGDLYAAYTGPLYETPKQVDGSFFERAYEEILAEFDLPVELAAEADSDAWDEVIRAETDLAVSRVGDDVGTPIITYGPPDGNSLFGPVISAVPDDETAVEFYRAVRIMVDVPQFSELKRSARAPLDLVALHG